MSKETTKFVVELKVPDGVSLTDMKEHIRTEVISGIGLRHPSDPITNLERKWVKVTVLKETIRR